MSTTPEAPRSARLTIRQDHDQPPVIELDGKQVQNLVTGLSIEWHHPDWAAYAVPKVTMTFAEDAVDVDFDADAIVEQGAAEGGTDA